MPRPFKHELSDHLVRHTSEIGWQDLDDKPLLEQADAEFDVFITADQNMRHQQNLSPYRLAVIVLIARTNRLQDLHTRAPATRAALEHIQPGDLLEIR